MYKKAIQNKLYRKYSIDSYNFLVKKGKLNKIFKKNLLHNVFENFEKLLSFKRIKSFSLKIFFKNLFTISNNFFYFNEFLFENITYIESNKFVSFFGQTCVYENFEKLFNFIGSKFFKFKKKSWKLLIIEDEDEQVLFKKKSWKSLIIVEQVFFKK